MKLSSWKFFELKAVEPQQEKKPTRLNRTRSWTFVKEKKKHYSQEHKTRLPPVTLQVTPLYMQSYNNNSEFIEIIWDYLFLDYWIKLYELLITFLFRNHTIDSYFIIFFQTSLSSGTQGRVRLRTRTAGIPRIWFAEKIKSEEHI